MCTQWLWQQLLLGQNHSLQQEGKEGEGSTQRRERALDLISAFEKHGAGSRIPVVSGRSAVVA